MPSLWDTFPKTYRQHEVSQIAAWIDAGESGLVVGLSGSGKSNVLGFIAHRPPFSSPPQAGGIEGGTLRPLLDFNRLPEPTFAAFLRQTLAALDDAAAAAQLPAEVMKRLRAILDKGLAQTDAFLLGRSVESALAFLCGEMQLRTVMLIDRFDVALERFDAPLFNNLRAWRDAHKTQLSYIVSARRDWPDWPNLPALSEFTELIAGRTCWVGALSPDDVRWNLARFAGEKPTKKVIERMMGLSGGHAGLLKTLWAAASPLQAVGKKIELDEWIKQSGVRRQCQELWDDLPASVRESLRVWQVGRAAPQDTLKSFLINTGLVIESEGELRLASSVFAAFVRQQAGAAGGILWRDAATAQVYRGGVKLPVELTPQEDRLLAYLLAHPGEVCDKDALAEAVWPEEVRVEGIRDDRLAQLVRRLREKVEPDPHAPRYVVPVWGRGYRLVADGSGS
jgi:energy-coupling factor transporter ATP-binding protein EcfA2